MIYMLAMIILIQRLSLMAHISAMLLSLEIGLYRRLSELINRLALALLLVRKAHIENRGERKEV